MNAERWSNILSVERAFRAGSSHPGGQPLEAYIEVAARCNLRCIMCPITVDPRYQPGSGWPGLLEPDHFERLRPMFATLQRAYLFGLGEPRRSRIARWLGKRGIGRAQPELLPEVWLDDHLLARVKDVGVLDGDRFALVIPVDFVSEGSHRLTLRAPRSEGSNGSQGVVWEERHLQIGAIEKNGGHRLEQNGHAALAAVSRLAFHVDLAREERRPRLLLDGSEHPLREWICGTYGTAWRAVAVVDVGNVAPGSHRLELELTDHPPHRRRIHRLEVPDQPEE